MSNLDSPTIESHPAVSKPACSGRGYALLAATLALVGVCIVFYRGWVTDDACITLRYVMNVHAGNGPVFNAGERVQGYTHPLWFLLLLVGSLFVDVYAAAVGLGLLLAATTVGVLAWFLRRRSDRELWLVLGFAGLFSSRTFVEFQTSGLETSLTTLLVTILVGWIASRENDEFVSLPGVAWLCALLLLTRPDHVVLCAPVIAVSAAHWRRDRRAGIKLSRTSRLAFLGAATAFLAWYGFATIYYGSPLPNTVYAKVNAPLSVTIPQGLVYARVYLASEPVHAILIVAALFYGIRLACRVVRGRRTVEAMRWGAVVLALAAHLAYVIAIGGDFMRGRFFLPVLVVAVILLAQMGAAQIALAARQGQVRTGLGIAAVVVVYAAAPWVQVLAALIDRAIRLLHLGIEPSAIVSIAPCLSPAFGIALLGLAIVAWRFQRQRRRAWLAWACLNVAFGLGVACGYTRGFGVYLALACIVVGTVVSIWRVGRRDVVLAALAGVFAASGGSLCDLGERAGPYRQTGVADEWAWYSAKKWGSPFTEPAEFRWLFPELCRERGESLRRYAVANGRFAYHTGGIGNFARHAGIDVHIIAEDGLTDAFIARAYEKGHSRVGHPDFEIPPEYYRSLGALNLLPACDRRIEQLDPTLMEEARTLKQAVVWRDPAAHERFRVVQLVTSGPLFSRERLLALPRFIFPRRPAGSQPSP